MRPRQQPTKLLGRGELIRFLIMIFLAAALCVVVFTNIFMLPGPNNSRFAPQGGGGGTVLVPKIHLDPKILAQIRDDKPRFRVQREPKPFEYILSQAARLVPGALEYMGLPKNPLDYDAVLKNPKAFRGKPVWVRAQLLEDPLVIDVDTLPGVKDVRGKARDEKGRVYYFSMAQPPRKPLHKGDWVKIKGFFYKLWDPDARGGKVPYIVGYRLYRSWPRWKPVKELDRTLFPEIMDGSSLDPEITEPEAFYHFLSYVINLPKEKADPSKLPRLTALLLTKLRNDPAGTRGKLFHFYAKIIREPQFLAMAENPLGLKWKTVLWAATTRPATVIRLIVPRRRTDLRREMEVEVIGCFLRNMEYQAADQKVGMASAPIFVSDWVRPHEVPVDTTLDTAKWVVAGILIAFILLLSAVSHFDRKRHLEAEKALARKRRERLAKKGSAPAPGGEGPKS